MLPLPSRTHPKNQTPVVYTEELTHLMNIIDMRREAVPPHAMFAPEFPF
jgi:hypothetical protein